MTCRSQYMVPFLQRQQTCKQAWRGRAQTHLDCPITACRYCHLQIEQAGDAGNKPVTRTLLASYHHWDTPAKKVEAKAQTQPAHSKGEAAACRHTHVMQHQHMHAAGAVLGLKACHMHSSSAHRITGVRAHLACQSHSRHHVCVRLWLLRNHVPTCTRIWGCPCLSLAKQTSLHNAVQV